MRIVCVAPSVLDGKLLRSRGFVLASLALAPGYLMPRLRRFNLALAALEHGYLVPPCAGLVLQSR